MLKQLSYHIFSVATLKRFVALQPQRAIQIHNAAPRRVRRDIRLRVEREERRIERQRRQEEEQVNQSRANYSKSFSFGLTI